MTRLRASKEALLFCVSTLLLLAGGLSVLGTLLGLRFSAYWTVGAIRRRELSVDVIAVLALAGALAVNEPFAARW